MATFEEKDWFDEFWKQIPLMQQSQFRSLALNRLRRRHGRDPSQDDQKNLMGQFVKALAEQYKMNVPDLAKEIASGKIKIG